MVDLYLFRIINSWAERYELLDKIFILSTDNLGYIALVILVTLFIKNRKKYKDVLILPILSAGVARFVLTPIIYAIYFRPRPILVLENVNQLIPHEATASFPSGHTTFYVALATGVYLVNRKLGIIYLLIAGIISFSRIFLGVHWPSDILAGAILGAGTSILIRKKLKI